MALQLHRRENDLAVEMISESLAEPACRSTILDPGNSIPSHFRVLPSVNLVSINEFETIRLVSGISRSEIRLTT